MRLHVHEGGSTGVLTHPDVPATSPLSAYVELTVDEVLYRVGNREELDVTLTLVEVFDDEHGHVIKHACREIQASIRYAGHETTLTTHPADLVKTVREEAIKHLKIDASTAADLVLRLAGQSEDLVATSPVGAYTTGTCSLTLDLVHVVRPQG